MSLLFTALSRRYRGLNESLTEFYHLQAGQVEQVRQQLQLLQQQLAKSSSRRITMMEAAQLFEAAWRSYSGHSTGSNVNITHAYSETQKLFRLILDEADSQLEDEESQDLADIGVKQKECVVGAGLRPDPADCAYFQQCAVVAAGVGVLVRQKCGPGTLFNPVHKVCDWPLNVYKIAPWCQSPEKSVQAPHDNLDDNNYMAAMKLKKTTVQMTPANQQTPFFHPTNGKRADELFKSTTPFPYSTFYEGI